MAKIKFKNFSSRNFAVLVYIGEDAKRWFVRSIESLSDTIESTDMDDYKKLKRVWRKSKEDFDSACRFMTFKDLFNYQEKPTP